MKPQCVSIGVFIFYLYSLKNFPEVSLRLQNLSPRRETSTPRGNSRFPDPFPVRVLPHLYENKNRHPIKLSGDDFIIVAGAGLGPASEAYGASRKTFPDPPAKRRKILNLK
jgi:hypothetical protein